MLLPECLLVLTATSIFLGGAFFRRRELWAALAILGYAAALGLLAGGERCSWTACGKNSAGRLPSAVDYLGHAVRWLALLAGALLTLMSWRSASRELASEYLGAMMLAIVGVMLTARANELVLMFLGLELVSIPTYVMLFLGTARPRLVRGDGEVLFLEHLRVRSLALRLQLPVRPGWNDEPHGRWRAAQTLAGLQAEGAAQLHWLAPVSLVLVFAGLGFKIAAVPFHFYAPDVYQGATNANAGWLAVAPKIAGIVALVRLVVVAMPTSAPFAWRLAMVLAMLTMTLGNVCALWQQNLRRLMAYSSIAHAGYMLIGLAVAMAAAETGQAGYGGVAAMLLYLLVYVLAALGTFAALTYLGSDEREVNAVRRTGWVGSSSSARGGGAGGLHVLPGGDPSAGRLLGQVGAAGWRLPLRHGQPGSVVLFCGSGGCRRGECGHRGGLLFAHRGGDVLPRRRIQAASSRRLVRRSSRGGLRASARGRDRANAGAPIRTMTRAEQSVQLGTSGSEILSAARLPGVDSSQTRANWTASRSFSVRCTDTIAAVVV